MRWIALISTIILAAAFASATVAYDYSPQTGNVTITMQKGWNMIPYINVSRGTCLDNTVTAAYFYSPVQNVYLGGYAKGNYTLSNAPAEGTVYVPSNANEIISSERASMYYHAMGSSTGMFVYSKAYCQFEAPIGKEQLTDFPWTVKKGWNFITLMPWMMGNNLKNILADCTITAANDWDELAQKWSQASSSEAARLFSENTQEIQGNNIGNVFPVKFGSDCKLRVSPGNPMTPPPLP